MSFESFEPWENLDPCGAAYGRGCTNELMRKARWSKQWANTEAGVMRTRALYCY